MRIVTVDFETYWDAEHTLSKMSPLTYCVSPRTQLISLGIKIGNAPADVVFGEDAIRRTVERIDWSDCMVIGHNLSGFDSMLLAWRLGVEPRMWGCTLAMARPLHAKTIGVSLEALVEHYGVGVKNQAILVQTKGKRLEDFTSDELEAMRVYNAADVEQCYALFHKLKPSFSAKELWHIDATIRMLVEPKFWVDRELLEKALAEEQDNKRRAILSVARALKKHNLASHDMLLCRTLSELEEAVRKDLASSARFAKLLESLGVEVPMKPSPTNPAKQVPALAKTDEAFLALQDHENEIVAAAARARLAVKSTLLETRIQAFLNTSEAVGGYLPVPLNYCGADTTGRWSGWAYNVQNLPRIDPNQPRASDALRKSLRAPKGYKIVVADLSGIELRINHFLWQVQSSMELYRRDRKADLYRAFAAARYGIAPEQVTKEQRQLAKLCLAEGTLVLTQRGEVPIEQVTAEDKVWDGVEWVSTLGAVYQGVKDVIGYDSLIATPDHVVWVEDGRKVPFGYAAAHRLQLARTAGFGVPLLFGGDEQAVEGLDVPIMGTNRAQRRVWDLLDCGPRRRFTANGRLVSNCQLGLGFGAGWKTFQRVAKLMGGLDLSDEEAEAVTLAWRTEYAEIVQGWRTCHDALRSIYDGEEREIDPWGLCVTCEEGIRLPSGRLIRYPSLHLEQAEDGKEEWWYGTGRHRARIYAGKVTENCVQALARDTIADNAVEFFKASGLRPSLMVHDELVYVVPEAMAQDVLNELQSIMRTPPRWWPELVTESEGSVADTYGAAK